MAYQNIFKRYEIKYMLTHAQKEQVLRAMQPHMALDKYGRTTIRNIYFDTDSYRLVRRSIEKPAYKEKLRIRSYCRADAQTTVFVELKKNYDDVVYKRRLAMPEKQAIDWICGGEPCPIDTQIADEINYFMDYYTTLRPKVFLTYEREAYYCPDGEDFRVTFDENILCRRSEMSLEADIGGTRLLEPGKVLMEIKTPGGIPMWMIDALSREHIYKTSFSKYGTAYEKMIYKGDLEYA